MPLQPHTPNSSLTNVPTCSVHTYATAGLNTNRPRFARRRRNTYVRTYAHTYVRTYVRTYVHVYVCTHVCTNFRIFGFLDFWIFRFSDFRIFGFLKYLFKKKNRWMTKCRKRIFFDRFWFFPCVHRPKGVRNSMISLGTEVLWAPYVQKISKT